MNDKEKGKMFKELLQQVLKDLTRNIENAKKENDRDRKMQDLIVEKVTIEIMFGDKLFSLQFVRQGIEHYCKLGNNINRNDILTRLTERTAELQKIKDPKELERLIKEYKKHQKEVTDLLKPSTNKIEIIQSRF